MAFGHLLDAFLPPCVPDACEIGRSRGPSVGLVHLWSMKTENTSYGAVEPALTLSQLAAHLSVSVQTLYDLRSKGRGPRGFRIGRELRFRRSEVEAWLARLEAADGARHPSGG